MHASPVGASPSNPSAIQCNIVQGQVMAMPMDSLVPSRIRLCCRRRGGRCEEPTCVHLRTLEHLLHYIVCIVSSRSLSVPHPFHYNYMCMGRLSLGLDLSFPVSQFVTHLVVWLSSFLYSSLLYLTPIGPLIQCPLFIYYCLPLLSCSILNLHLTEL